MRTIFISDRQFEIYLTSEQIEIAISRIAGQINEDFSSRDPIFIGVLNGSFIFCADLLKKVQIPCQVSFVRLNSYSGIKSTGNVSETLNLDKRIEGKHVIILEDIIETGNTMRFLIDQLNSLQPASISVACLLMKEEYQVHHEDKIDYIGFNIPDKFVVGYGLDFEGYGRNFPHIYQLID